MTSPFDSIEILHDVDDCVEWEDVAVALAQQVLAQGGWKDAIARLEAQAIAGLNEETRRQLADMEHDRTGWEAHYVAARVLRDTNERHPRIAGAEESRRLARQLAEAQRLAAGDAQREDPTRCVLVSPRIRDNVIERIVHTYGGRVVAEYLHTGAGWMRHRVGDLREILERGVPVPARIAQAMSREPGELDELPTEEIADRLLALDPSARFSAAPDVASRQLLFPELDAAESFRITEAELRDPRRHVCRTRLAGDASNAELAAELLDIVPARWNSATLEALAPPNGPRLLLRVHGPRPEDGAFRPTTRLLLLVARRFEMMECEYRSPWRRFAFSVTRADHPEWHCETSYEFTP